MTLVLDQSAGGNLVNTATVSRAEAEFDNSDNTVSSTISATPLADLELKRTDLLGSNSNHYEHEDDQIISEFASCLRTKLDEGRSGASDQKSDESSHWQRGKNRAP